MTSNDTYLEQLENALRRRGLDSAHTAEVLEEVTNHLNESGDRPLEAFGEPDEYAAALVATNQSDAADPEQGYEVRTFRAAAFDEVDILADLGRDGWELTGVRDFGLHARRPEDPTARATWEYKRRQAVRRGPVLEEMEAAGWTQCGHWVTFRYFKRPMDRFPNPIPKAPQLERCGSSETEGHGRRRRV